MGRFLSKTGNLKTRKVKKKKDRFGYGKTRRKEEREEGEEGKREGRNGF